MNQINKVQDHSELLSNNYIGQFQSPLKQRISSNYNINHINEKYQYKNIRNIQVNDISNVTIQESNFKSESSNQERQPHHQKQASITSTSTWKLDPKTNMLVLTSANSQNFQNNQQANITNNYYQSENPHYSHRNSETNNISICSDLRNNHKFTFKPYRPSADHIPSNLNFLGQNIQNLKQQIKNYNIVQINQNNNININYTSINSNDIDVQINKLKDLKKQASKQRENNVNSKPNTNKISNIINKIEVKDISNNIIENKQDKPKLPVIYDNELKSFDASRFIKNMEFKKKIYKNFVIPLNFPKNYRKSMFNNNWLTNSKDCPDLKKKPEYKEKSKRRKSDVFKYNKQIQQVYVNWQEKLNKHNYTISDINIQKVIGTGSYAKVYQAFDLVKKRKCALKCIDRKKLQQLGAEQYAQQEIDIQKVFRHQGIVKVYASFQDNNFIYVIQELIEGGDLNKLIKLQPDKRYSEDKAKVYIKQVIQAIMYMHQNNVIHRDIKPENILIQNDQVKLADLGFASKVSKNDQRTTFCGTPHYISPEMIKGEKYSYSVDIWALGILTYELTTGRAPFIFPTEKMTYQNIVENNKNYEKWMSNELKDFIELVLATDKENRISLEKCLKHDWLKDID